MGIPFSAIQLANLNNRYTDATTLEGVRAIAEGAQATAASAATQAAQAASAAAAAAQVAADAANDAADAHASSTAAMFTANAAEVSAAAASEAAANAQVSADAAVQPADAGRDLDLSGALSVKVPVPAAGEDAARLETVSTAVTGLATEAYVDGKFTVGFTGDVVVGSTTGGQVVTMTFVGGLLTGYTDAVP